MALLEEFRHDLTFAARQLRRHLAFTVTVIVTLAIGLGANTAIFSALSALTLRPLPFPEPDRLAAVQRDGKPAAAAQETFALWRREARAVTGAAGLSLRTWGLATAQGVVVVESGMFTPGFFDVLGISPALGRAPQEKDRRTVWLSHALWRQRFESNTGVAGHVIRLNEDSYTVAGVLPESFAFQSGERTPGLYFPLEPGYFATHALVRLAPGVTPAQAQQELRALAANAGDRQATKLSLRDLREELHAGADRPYWILMAAVATLLLVALLNLANLLLARFTSRLREIAVRSSIGASHGRLLRQFFAEAALVTGLGTIAALATAYGALSWMELGGLFRPQLDLRVLAFLVALAMAVVALLTAAPVMMLRGLDLHHSMKAPRAGWRRGLLIAGQVAGSLALLTVTALFLRSFVALTAVDPGFRADGLLVAGIGIPETRYDTDAKMARFYEDVLGKMAVIPGVTAVGGAAGFPLVSAQRTRVRLPGLAVTDAELPTAQITLASPGFFATTGIALRAGRLFEAGDRVGRPRVALVNEAFVRQYGVGEGRVLQLSWWNPGNPRWSPWQIAGVVADVRSRQLHLAPEPHVYLPLNQFAAEGLHFAVRARETDHRAVSDAMAAAVHAVDPNLQRIQPRPLVERLAESLSERRATLRLIAVFAFITLLLCAGGVYGLTAYHVHQSKPELAIRRALGAGEHNVVWHMIGHGLRWAGVGVAAGLALSLVATRAIATQLYGVSARDPLALAGALVTLAAVTLLGCWLPARRAAQVDPASVLRHQ